MYPLSAKLLFKEVSKWAGRCKPCSAVMLVAHRAQQNNHLKVLMENKGKKRRDKSSTCLSLWSVVRETCSPNLALKTISPAKFLGQTSPRHSIWLVELQLLELCLCQKYIDLSLNKTSLRTALQSLQNSLIHTSKRRLLWSYQKQNKWS